MRSGYFLFVALLLLLPGIHAAAQQHDDAKWRLLFNAAFDKVHAADRILWDSIYTKPPQSIKTIIQTLEDEIQSNGADETAAKLSLLKSMYCHTYSDLYNSKDWKFWGNKSLTTASNIDDDYILQSCCLFLGDAYLSSNNYDTAVFYLLKTVELSEKLGYEEQFIVSNKISVSNALYRTKNYLQCIDYCKTDYDIESKFAPITVITAYNNTGLSFLRLNVPDSAIYYFTKAATYSHKKNWGVWEGIVLGNMGDAYHAKGADEKAMSYWQTDYDSSMKYNEHGNAGLTLAYMSEYEFNHGQPQKAIRQLQWATAVNKDDAGNLLRIDKIKGDCYRKLGLHDSADYFLDEHYRLSDSINQVVSRNNFSTVQMRMAFEKNNYDFDILRKERRAEVARRNLLLLALIASLLAGLLLYNRERLKAKLEKQKNRIAEAEKISANEQLLIFTQTLLEKNEQIEQLATSLQQQTDKNADELIHQTLLTEFDWNRFKELFEKIHPYFFTRLKAAAPGVTQSEMRLAALIKLNLGNKQMASMQGISVSSLRGNKTRLRQKLNISADTDIDDLIKQL